MKVIKLYLNYFFYKSNLILYLFFLFFITFSYYLSINDLNDNMSYKDVIDFYFKNGVYYSKIIVVFISIIQFSKLYNERNQYVLNFVITAGYSKKQNYNYMILGLAIINIIFVIILYLLFILIGVLSKSYFVIESYYLNTFLNIYILSIVYGLLSYLTSIIFDNQYYFILVLLLFLISDIFIDSRSIISYAYYYIFPNIKDNGNMISHYFFIIYEVIVLLYLSRKKYVFVDLKN